MVRYGCVYIYDLHPPRCGHYEERGYFDNLIDGSLVGKKSYKDLLFDELVGKNLRGQLHDFSHGLLDEYDEASLNILKDLEHFI